MVKNLHIDEPELRWQKSWIARKVEPRIQNLSKWINKIDLMPSLSLQISPRQILFMILLVLFIKFSLNWLQHMLELFNNSKRLDSGSLISAFLIFQYRGDA